MILHDLHLTGTEGIKHIHIEQGKIKSLNDSLVSAGQRERTIHLDLKGAMAFPGLINSHDHLDFNLFPRLGNRVYNNYTEWGEDIHSVNKNLISRVEKVPKPLRVMWGLYKNLLNGFTTVVNHGEKFEIKDDLITVFQDCYPLHSTSFEHKWKWKLNNPFQTRKPYVMHLGEGRDEWTKSEIDKVIRWNLFRKKIVAVHGVAMNEKQSAAFPGLIWCPASNFFLLNRTASVDQLKHSTNVVFGSDSTLTSPWNLWEHLRQARDCRMMEEDELMRSLTIAPAILWGLSDSGTLAENKIADIVVTKNTDDFFSLNPEDILLVIHRGQIRLYDEVLADQLKTGLPGKFGCISSGNRTKHVQGDLSGLVKEIAKYGIQVNW